MFWFHPLLDHKAYTAGNSSFFHSFLNAHWPKSTTPSSTVMMGWPSLSTLMFLVQESRLVSSVTVPSLWLPTKLWSFGCLALAGWLLLMMKIVFWRRRWPTKEDGLWLYLGIEVIRLILLSLSNCFNFFVREWRFSEHFLGVRGQYRTEVLSKLLSPISNYKGCLFLFLSIHLNWTFSVILDYMFHPLYVHCFEFKFSYFAQFFKSF